jgi:hypothetical protein
MAYVTYFFASWHRSCEELNEFLISKANQIFGEPNGKPTEADIRRRRATSRDDVSS